MTETQRKWLTEYLGECDHNNDKNSGIFNRCTCGAICGNLAEHIKEQNRTFTTAQDKQDLLEAIIRKNEWYSVVWDMNGELMESQSGEFAGFKNYAKSFLFALSDSNESFTIKLIQLSPLETAELICRWKGVS